MFSFKVDALYIYMCVCVCVCVCGVCVCGPGSSVGIATELRPRRCWIESRQGRDFPPVQTGPGVLTASCTTGTGSCPGVKCGRGVGLTPSPHLVLKVLEKSRAIPLLTLRACVAYRKVKTYIICEVKK